MKHTYDKAFDLKHQLFLVKVNDEDQLAFIMRELRVVSKIMNGDMLSYQVLKFYEQQAKIYKILYQA